MNLNQAIVLSLLLTANAEPVIKLGHGPIVKKYRTLRRKYRGKLKYHGNRKYRRALHRTAGADRAHFQR